MRTGADDFIAEEQDEAEFRRLLSAYAEPSHPTPPPSLVTRITRQLPHVPPATLLRRQQMRQLLSWCGVLALLALVGYGSWLLTTGAPGGTSISGSAQGLGRALLSIRLALKPALAVLSSAALPLLLVGCLATLSVILLVWRTAQAPHDLPARA
jgi:hypothetical protein